MDNLDICSKKCFGKDNHHGQCCYVDGGNWILGPLSEIDSSRFIQDLSKKFGKEIKYEDVFISYEEGIELFPDKPSWKQEDGYPSIRFDTKSEKNYCIFYNQQLRICSVYDIRPTMCRNYTCDYLKKNHFNNNQ